MNRKSFIHLASISLLASACAKYSPNQGKVISLSADSLKLNVDYYKSKMVEIEGLALHICGVDGRKLKLETESGRIIKIIPKENAAGFESDLKDKWIRVQGVVSEKRYEMGYIDRHERMVTQFCHIDYSPCKDLAWVQNNIEKGNAGKVSHNMITNMRKELHQTKNNHLSICTVCAEAIMIIQG